MIFQDILDLKMGMVSLVETNDLQAFENTSTSVAASQMRNALNTLSDTVKDPAEKKVRPQTHAHITAQ